MGHKKKHSGHECKNHNGIVAIAKCEQCKSWICKKCGNKIGLQWFCNSCIADIPEQTNNRPNFPFQKSDSIVQNSSAFSRILFLAAITLCLCGILFGLWNMRKSGDLSVENAVLREKRGELLDEIRQRNNEISSLSQKIDSLSQNISLPAVVAKNPPSQKSTPETVLKAINGLPFSFDNGTPYKKCMAFTFDGSDGTNAVNDILDTLQSRNVKVTMFLSGQFIQRKTETVRSIIARGHEIGNHTYSHPHLTTYVQDHTQSTSPSISEQFLSHELLKTDSIFASIFGKHMAPLWRSPYGEHNHTICIWAQHAGFLHIGWGQGRTWRKNLDSNDWTPNEETEGYHTPQEVYEKIISLAKEQPNGINGGIILMHLGTQRKQREKQVHLILGELIDSLRSLGYSIVTVSELLRESDVDISVISKNETK